MKRTIAAILAAGVIALVAVVAVVYRSPRQGSDYSSATPESVIEDFYAAAIAGDGARARHCLAEHLQTRAEQLIQQKRDIQQILTESVDTTEAVRAKVMVHEIRKRNTLAVPVELSASDGRWRIVHFGAPRPVELNVPHGTPVDEVPEP